MTTTSFELEKRFAPYEAYQKRFEIKEPERFHDGYVFRLDYSPTTPDAVLQNDVITYLEEYRLQVKKSRYDLLYTRGDDDLLALRSSDNGESMLIIGQNSIKDREKQGKSIKKETADLIGMQKIQEYMEEAIEGETLLWASPPDPEVGYDYGFFYIGTVEKIDEEQKRLKMAAMRLDKGPTLRQFNSALSLLSQEEIHFDTVNQFISNPLRLKREVTQSEIDFVLGGSFEFVKDHREEARINEIKIKLQPYIDTFKSMVKEGASESMLRRMMFALENYTIYLKGEKAKIIFETEKKSSGSFIDQYSYIPPKVIGSCDIAPSGSSANMLGYGSIFSPTLAPMGKGSEKNWSYTWGECRLCNDKFTQVGPCKICKTCEKKFD